MTDSISLHPLQHLTFTILPIKRVENVILLCPWLTFPCLLVSLSMCVSFSMKCLFKSFAHFFPLDHLSFLL